MTRCRAPVGQTVTAMLSALDDIAALALDPVTVAEVAAEDIKLGRIISRARLILAFIDANKPQPMLWVLK